jgi:hypothetical protein
MNTATTKRFRCAVGLLDSDSDEDLEIDASAASTSCGINITHRAFSSKRQKINHADEQVAKSSSAMPDIVPEAIVEANPIEERERNQVRVS